MAWQMREVHSVGALCNPVCPILVTKMECGHIVRVKAMLALFGHPPVHRCVVCEMQLTGEITKEVTRWLL